MRRSTPGDTVERLSEFDIIRDYLAPLADDPGAFGLRDDAARLRVPSGHELVVSKDLLVSDVHFFATDPPDLIAQKALRANVSDLIAKGAKPTGYFLGLAFETPPSEAFLRVFSDGLRRDQRSYGLTLFGGDTTRLQKGFMISVTVFGLVENDGAITRLGAKPGDGIYVTGTLGDAALGLIAHSNPASLPGLSKEDIVFLRMAYLLPNPPAAIAPIIRQYASASMDISDGMLGDLCHLCRASNVSAAVEEKAFPMSAVVRAAVQFDANLYEIAIKGGDDYQCLLTVPPSDEDAFAKACATNAVDVAKIGTITERKLMPVSLTRDGRPSTIKLRGFEHF